MLGDEDDVFDSVTWETPSPQTYDVLVDNPTPGRGFRELAPDSQNDGNPNDPKWEGYLITSVKDPVKEMAETKDAYVSYLVSAKVCCFVPGNGDVGSSALKQDQSIHILYANAIFKETISRLCVPTGSSCKELPCMCSSFATRQTAIRYVSVSRYHHQF